MDEGQALAAKLQMDQARLTEFMLSLTEADWSAPVYTEGTTWTVRSVLAHLVSAERAFVRLFDEVRLGGAGVPEDFVIDRYNASQQRKAERVEWMTLLEEYGATRLKMIDLVRGLTAGDLERQGRHPYLGVTTLREMVKMIYIHGQSHCRDIRRSLRKDQG